MASAPEKASVAAELEVSSAVDPDGSSLVGATGVPLVELSGGVGGDGGVTSSGVFLRRRRQKPRGLGVDWAMRFASSWAG
ncbi:hypothetical protein FB475_5222 [Kribbella jejuensis]|uniref:Uncharacterized protein n=1 Tax=Kribbella jejuensis TaxID=236068 RepID=A0A542EAC4_9ACTN|nr:hypothetical protein FB475_5222 [Kribbella jejuensis]